MAEQSQIDKNRELVAKAFPRLSAPNAVPQARLTQPITIGKGVQFGGTTGKKKDQGDKGLLSGLASIVPSAIGGIGQGISAIPSFIGKGVQTGVGLGELALDTATNLVDRDLYRSRIEKDWQKGKDLGLKGEELLAYAGQRQLPLAVDISRSMLETGRSLTELGTGGTYDFGEPGFDYANSFRRGELGAKLVGDVGNIILAGRLVGAGNLIEGAGASLAETAPRLGKAVSSAGRFIEEPIGESARLAGRAGVGVARTLGNVGAENALRRIYYDEINNTIQGHPIRTLVNMSGERWRERNYAKAAEFTDEAAKLRAQADAATDQGTKSNLMAQAFEAERKAASAVQGTGIIGKARKGIWRMTVATERLVQQIQTEFRRMAEKGPVPESPADLRRQAENIRANARKQGLEGEALATQEANAVERERRATIKEQFPQEFDKPLDPATSGAVALVYTGLGRVAKAMRAEGFDDQTIATFLQSPEVGPTLEQRSMGITPEMVDKAIAFDEFVTTGQSPLNAGQALAMQAYFELYLAWGEMFDKAVREGKGIPQGPLPESFFGFFPEPKYLLENIATWPPMEKIKALRVLEFLTAEAVYEYVRQGVATADDFAEIGINYEKLLDQMDKVTTDDFAPDATTRPFQGIYDKTVQAGPNTLGYEVAVTVVKNAFPNLRQVAPELMMNPDIYPARMRTAVMAQRQQVRAATAMDVATMTEQLNALANEFQTQIPKQILEGIARDIEKAQQPGMAVSKTTWVRMSKRIATVLKQAKDERARLIGAGRLLDQAAQLNVLELERAIDALTRANEMVRTVVDVSRKEDLPQPLREAQTAREAAEATVADLQSQTVAARQELAQLEARPGEPVVPPEVSGIETNINRLNVERNRLEDELLYVDSLDEYTIEDIVSERNYLAEDVAKGPVEVPEPTVDELKATRQAEVDKLKTEADKAELIHGIIAGGGGKIEYRGVGATRKALLGLFRRAEMLQEDFWIPFQHGLAQAGIPLSEVERVWKDWVNAHSNKPRLGVDPGLGVDVKMMTFDPANVAPEYGGSLGAATGWEQAVEITSPEQYMETLGFYYGRWKAQELKAKELAKRKPETFRDEYVAQRRQELDPLQAVDPETGQPVYSGRSVEELDRIIKLYESPEAMSAALDRVLAIENEIAGLRQRIVDVTSESTLARPRTPEEIKGLSRLSTLRIKLEKQLKELESLRSKEVTQIRRHIKEGGRRAVRARLKGVGTLKDGKPALLKDVSLKLTDTAQQLENRQKNIEAKLQGVRRDQALTEGRIETTTGVAETPRLRDVYTAPDFLVGPELFNPETDIIGYFPMGPTAGALPRASTPMQIIGEGAGAQNEPAFTRRRATAMLVLTPEDAAQKLSSVIRQMQHNETVEMLLRDPVVTSSTRQVLGEDWWAKAVEEETARANQQLTAELRTPEETAKVVQQEVGRRAMRELSDKGYVPVSPVKVDPTTGVHAPVGDLLAAVDVYDMTPDTFVMRKGVKERIQSQYVKRGASDAPVGVAKVLNKIERGTYKWKSAVLPISLRWQLGDAVSNVMNAWLRGGIAPKELIRASMEVVRRMKDPTDASLGNLLFGDLLSEAMNDPVLSAVTGTGLQGRGQRLEELLFERRFDENFVASIQDPTARTRAGEYFNRLRSRAFRFNEAQNTIARAAVALIKLEEELGKVGRTLDEVNGVSALADPVISKALHDSVDATNNMLGAFSELSPWEKSVMRQLYPFWSWVKFINKAAMEIAIDSPDRVLFYAHLGSMASDPDQNGFLDFLRGKTPVGPYLFDLNFLNPYQDAMIFTGNPLSASGETFTSLSPTITVPFQMLGEAYYGATGRELPYARTASRPGYLEGRPGATTRTLGDTLGGIGYIGLKGLVPPFRNVLEVLPTGTIPGTDVATGPGPKYPQGSARTTGMYAEPRLGPVMGRLAAVGRTFGVPSPLIETKLAREQAKTQAQRDKAARLRRIKERKAAKGG